MLKLLLPVMLLALVAVGAAVDDESAPHHAPVDSPFAPSRLATASGELADGNAWFQASDCGACHVDQYDQWLGSAHSRAHHDGLYRAFADLAREEAGDEMYRFCSSCHAPLAVATGEIPGNGQHTYLTDEGVSCEVCHQASEVRPVHAGGGANASLLLQSGDVRYGPNDDPDPNMAHESQGSALHRSATLCSACHTLIHPHNGLVIENTYEEWIESPYAAAGVQCQDCHMRTVDQALEVARTMAPVRVPGRTSEFTERPDVKAHLFVGGNANGELVGLSDEHVAQAEQRLQSAAELALELPREAAAGQPVELVVAVTNVAAGHTIPTSITELRQVWIDLEVRDGAGTTVYRSGAVDERGAVDPEAVMYHSVLVDEQGEVTFKPWTAARMVKEKLIPPKETVRERYALELPAGLSGPLSVRATLRYRSAPQDVMDELFGQGRYTIRTIDMASAEGSIALR